MQEHMQGHTQLPCRSTLGIARRNVLPMPITLSIPAPLCQVLPCLRPRCGPAKTVPWGSLPARTSRPVPPPHHRRTTAAPPTHHRHTTDTPHWDNMLVGKLRCVAGGMWCVAGGMWCVAGGMWGPDGTPYSAHQARSNIAPQ